MYKPRAIPAPVSHQAAVNVTLSDLAMVSLYSKNEISVHADSFPNLLSSSAISINPNWESFS
jgi:hypothetical protein